MGYFYVVKADGTVEKHRTGKKHLGLEDCYKAIGCDWVEAVRFSYRNKTYEMIVDEEGKLTDQPYNTIATILYGNQYDCICGNAVIVKTVAWAPFSESQAVVFENDLFVNNGISVTDKTI